MSTVLITGLNGFVAVHAAVVYLKNGWSVRGTVRSQDKADKVEALSAFKDYPGKVEVVIIKDLIEGDYTEALKGVDAIAHCASPWHFKGESWASYRDPAVKGTTNLLEQAAKVSSIKAVSLMSSFASIGDFSSPPEKQKDRTYTEKDWSPLTEEQCEGEGASPMMWYPASKKFAELAAFEVQKKTGNTFTLGTVCPPLILGPAIHIDSATGEELADVDVSTSSIYKAIAAGKDAEIPDTAFPIYGDVRNVADALFAIVDKKADGRFAICNGLYDFQQLANRAREIAPQYVESIPVGKPNELVSQKGCYTLDASKAERELGIKYISEDQMIKDVLEQFAAIGAIKA